MSGGRDLVCFMGRNVPHGVSASFLLIPLALPHTNQDAKQCMQIPPYTPLSSSKIAFGEFLVPLSELDNHPPICTAGGEGQIPAAPLWN